MISPDNFINLIEAPETSTDEVKLILKDHPEYANIRLKSGISITSHAVYNFKFELAKEIYQLSTIRDLATCCAIDDLNEIEKRILEGADPNELTVDGFTPLSLSCAFGTPESVALLLSHKADPNKRGTALDKIAPIHAAIFGRKPQNLNLLLEAGADPELPQENGFTPIQGAVQNRDQMSMLMLANAILKKK